MSCMSADLLCSTDSRTSARRRRRSSSVSRFSSASLYSAGANLTSFAVLIAAARASTVGASEAISSRSASRARCLGSSSWRIARASFKVASSTPAVAPCWMANFRAATLRDAIASANFSAALSRDSAPDRRSWNSLSSSAARPAAWAARSASRRADARPADCAARSLSRARSLGSSTRKISFAAATSSAATPVCSALAIASARALAAFASIAANKSSRASCRALSPLSWSAASATSSSEAPAACACLMRASSSFATTTVPITVANFLRATVFGCSSSCAKSSTVTGAWSSAAANMSSSAPPAALRDAFRRPCWEGTASAADSSLLAMAMPPASKSNAFMAGQLHMCA
mmetsp:Transcript_73587/g.225078  ORF Transcript_73587/g.225078 Transcript_73587/m.225078 type:complete len:347 (+) Transcript_73587:1189-2229(+)